jgi:ABC-2 type transport system permease protein
MFQVIMRTVLTMAMKDLRLISRDWLGLFFILGFPILMGIFFGSMYGSVDSESAALNIAVVDEDRSDMSARFVESLGGTGKVSVQPLGRTEAIDRVRRGQLVGMVAIPKGFGDSAGILWMEGPAIEVGIDPSRKAEAGMLEGMIMQAVGKLMVARFQDPASMRPLIKQTQDEIAASPDIPILLRAALSQFMNSLDGMLQTWADVQVAEKNSAERESAGAPTANGPEFQLARIETIDVTREIPKGSVEGLMRQLRSKWDISFPQAMMWGLMACSATFAATIVRERKQGTFFRLQAAPATRAHIVAGKATACFFAVIGVIAVMMVLGIWLGMRPRSPGLLAIASATIAFCFVGIMVLMSVIGKTEEAVSGAAWGANMIMAMFGGAMIPLVFMPSFMKTLSHFSPVKWSILSLEGAIWRGFTMSEMLLPCGALVLTGAVCLVTGTAVLSRAAE